MDELESLRVRGMAPPAPTPFKDCVEARPPRGNFCIRYGEFCGVSANKLIIIIRAHLQLIWKSLTFLRNAKEILIVTAVGVFRAVWCCCAGWWAHGGLQNRTDKIVMHVCVQVCLCVCVMHKREGWVCAQLPIPSKWVKLNTLFLLTLSLFCLCISSSYAHKQTIKHTHKRKAHNYIGVRMFLLVFSFSKFLPGLRLQIVGIWTETLSPLRWAYFSDWQTLWGSCCTCYLLRWLLNLGTVEFI